MFCAICKILGDEYSKRNKPKKAKFWRDVEAHYDELSVDGWQKLYEQMEYELTVLGITKEIVVFH